MKATKNLCCFKINKRVWYVEFGRYRGFELDEVYFFFDKSASRPNHQILFLIFFNHSLEILFVMTSPTFENTAPVHAPGSRLGLLLLLVVS